MTYLQDLKELEAEEAQEFKPERPQRKNPEPEEAPWWRGRTDATEPETV